MSESNPSPPKKMKRSLVWDHFSNSNGKAKCNHCGQVTLLIINYMLIMLIMLKFYRNIYTSTKGSTTNLLKHISKQHRDIIQVPEKTVDIVETPVSLKLNFNFI